MTKIIFEGWDVGMRTIPFIKLLKYRAGLSLKEATDRKERLVIGEKVEIEVDNYDLANQILEEAISYKVKGRIEE